MLHRQYIYGFAVDIHLEIHILWSYRNIGVLFLCRLIHKVRITDNLCYTHRSCINKKLLTTAIFKECFGAIKFHLVISEIQSQVIVKNDIPRPKFKFHIFKGNLLHSWIFIYTHSGYCGIATFWNAVKSIISVDIT